MNWILLLLLLTNMDNKNCCQCKNSSRQTGGNCNCKKVMERPADHEILKCGPSCELKNMMPPSWHSVTEETKCDCE